MFGSSLCQPMNSLSLYRGFCGYVDDLPLGRSQSLGRYKDQIHGSPIQMES